MKTTSTTTQSVDGPRGPMAKIDNLIGRGRWSVQHYGASLGDLFLDALHGLLGQLRSLLDSNRAEADSVHTRAAELVSAQREASKDGVIDPGEARRLAAAQTRLLELTGAHQKHAAELTQ